MSWNLRLQQMIMAGGVFSFSACNGGNGSGLQPGQNSDAATDGGTVPVVSFPCVNASPDPCICGREGDGPDALQMCQACWANHGQWQPAAATESQRCIGGADAAATDTSEAADGGGGSDATHADAAGTDAAGGASGAGGGDAAGGTGGTPWTIPCGNANPDPCICGRAGVSADAEQLCRDCQTNGGQWHATSGAQAEQCVGGHDAGTSDGDANSSHG